jgi:hypothetical protein
VSELAVASEELRWKLCWRGRLALAYNRGCLRPGDFYRSKPDWYPVLTPSGREVTQASAYRYNHHHSLWIGHGDVNGVNVFHDNNPGRPRLGDIVVEHAEPSLADGAARLESTNGWIAKDGQRLLTERRAFAFHPGERAHALDVTSELIASEGAIRLAKETHSFFGARVADTIDVEDGGRIVNANGDENEAGAMGKLAAWIDYSGEVAGAPAGITLMHHPANPPTPFFCRDYGTMLSNLTLHEPWEISPGASLLQRWRVLIHDGDTRTFDPEDAYRAWVASTA